MPLRYKRLIILFSLGIMLIGLGTFSLLSPSIFHGVLPFSGSDSKNDIDVSKAQLATLGAIDKQDENTEIAEINQLVNDYFNAKQRVDMEAMKSLVSNIGHVDEKKLLIESAYVEAYEDIQCMIMLGSEEHTYRVYVYYFVKPFDVDVKIPSLTALYVKQGKNGDYQIWLDQISSKEQRTLDKLDSSEKVRNLAASVESQLKSIISSDKRVRDFYEMLESAGKEEEQKK